MLTKRTDQSSKLPIKLAILGAGNMGQRLAAAFQVLPQVSIQYVYSRTLDQAERLAAQCGAKPVQEIAPIVEDPEVNAVVICLPTFTRLESLRPLVASQKAYFLRKTAGARIR